MTCTENETSVPYYCRDCFGSGWNEGNGSCNGCRQRYANSLVLVLRRGLKGGGNIEKIKFFREIRPDGTIIESVVINFRDRRTGTVRQVTPRPAHEEATSGSQEPNHLPTRSIPQPRLQDTSVEETFGGVQESDHLPTGSIPRYRLQDMWAQLPRRPTGFVREIDGGREYHHGGQTYTTRQRTPPGYEEMFVC